jgi:hypothetical protein
LELRFRWPSTSSGTNSGSSPIETIEPFLTFCADYGG